MLRTLLKVQGKEDVASEQALCKYIAYKNYIRSATDASEHCPSSVRPYSIRK